MYRQLFGLHYVFITLSLKQFKQFANPFGLLYRFISPTLGLFYIFLFENQITNFLMGTIQI